MRAYNRRLLVVRGLPAGFDMPFVRCFLDIFGRYRSIHHVDDQKGRLVPVVAVSYGTADEAAGICNLINESGFLGIEAHTEDGARARRERHCRRCPGIRHRLDALKAKYERHVAVQDMAEQLVGSYMRHRLRPSTPKAEEGPANTG